MCYPVQCPTCGKTGWGGCGEHVDAVMQNVPVARRCSCRADFITAGQDHAELRGDPGTRSR